MPSLSLSLSSFSERKERKLVHCSSLVSSKLLAPSVSLPLPPLQQLNWRCCWWLVELKWVSPSPFTHTHTHTHTHTEQVTRSLRKADVCVACHSPREGLEEGGTVCVTEAWILGQFVCVRERERESRCVYVACFFFILFSCVCVCSHTL